MKTSTINKKIKTEYPKLIRQAESRKDNYTAAFWRLQIETLKLVLISRNKNRKRNQKKCK